MKNYEIEIYRLDVEAEEFSRLAIIKTAKNLSWVSQLNKIGGARFDINIDDPLCSPDILKRFINVVAIKEINEDDLSDAGTVVWAGFITSLSGNYSDNFGTVQVEANCPLHALMSRYTDYELTYTSTEQADIAWGLINMTQGRTNGFLGISSGTMASGKTRDRTYERGQVGELLINLSNLADGFDFALEPVTGSGGLFTGWEFQTSYPRNRTFRKELNKLQIGDNIQNLQFNTSGDIYNYVTGIGEGTGRGTLTSVQENTAGQKGYTRRECFFNNKDVKLQDTLDEQTAGFLLEAQTEKTEIKVTLRPDSSLQYGSFRIGDYLYVDLHKGILDLSEWRLVTALEVAQDDEGTIFISPTLSII